MHSSKINRANEELKLILVLYIYKKFLQEFDWETLYYLSLSLETSENENTNQGNEVKLSEDNENSGLNVYYFNARYYDATTGRFINVDPVQDGFNWYVYAHNNPLNRVDPTGLDDYKLMEKQGFANTTGAEKTSNSVRYFKQGEFDDRYKNQDKSLNKGYGHDNSDYTELNTACHVTANLNEISEEYTKVTGKSMTKDTAEKMLDNSVKNGSSDVWGNIKKDSEKAEFFNDAWATTGEKGTWEKNDTGEHTVYLTRRYPGPHYESNGPTGSYQNPWSGKEESLSKNQEPKANNIYHYQRKEK